MACSSCAARAAARQNNALQQRAQPPQSTDCDYTKTLLQNWYLILNCVKATGKQNLIGLNAVSVNSYLGYLQSALNYPDNYCYYFTKLQEFQFNILPRIIAHVSECSN